MALDDTLDKQNDEIEALTSTFESQFSRMLGKAQAATLTTLGKSLTYDPRGRIDQTPDNRAALRDIDDVFQGELDDLGLSDLVDSFVHKFGGQFKYFRQVVEDTVSSTVARRIFSLKFTPNDQKFFSMAQADAATALEDMVSQAASTMRRKALLSIGALDAKSLGDLIAEQVGKTAGQAKSEAATALSSFYRTIADTNFRKVEEDDGWEVKYRYVGPGVLDPVIRPFCRMLMAESLAGSTWTRDEIDDMDNDQLDDVFVTGGGYNCRHQWIIATVEKKGPLDAPKEGD